MKDNSISVYLLVRTELHKLTGEKKTKFGLYYVKLK